MGINITHTMNGYQYENRENLQNATKNMSNKQSVSEEATNTATKSSIFNSDNQFYSNAQLSILKASAQISIHSTLKETLKYLKKHPDKKREKTPVFGELWNLFTNEENEFNDIIELNIDYSAKNIFEAA